MADRLPQQLEDEIKKKQAEFYHAAEMVNPSDLYDVIPVAFPMTHILDKEIFPGIAQYPIWKWEKGKQECITHNGWCKLCIKIAEGDMDNLGLIFDRAQGLMTEEPRTSLPASSTH